MTRKLCNLLLDFLGASVEIGDNRGNMNLGESNQNIKKLGVSFVITY